MGIFFIHLFITLLFSYYFIGCKNSSGENVSDKNMSGNSDYENKKKELELKEKELELKEKEIQLSSRLSKISENEVKTFIENWAHMQTAKAFDSYSNQYSPDFQGIKRTKSGKVSYFNYSDWLNDRRKMYSSADNLNVSAYDIKINSFDERSGLTKISFTQYYSSAKYEDEGLKSMHLKRDDKGNIKIVREEMIYSGEVVDGC